MDSEIISPPGMSERSVFGLTAIRRAEYEGHSAQLQHLFLAGDLKQPTPHPFFRRSDLEFILCTYPAGAEGAPHWHTNVDELEIILEGRIGYREAPSGRMLWFETGDFVHVPKGTCVKRTVVLPSRTGAMKIPSDSSSVTCKDCPRECAYRLEPYLPA